MTTPPAGRDRTGIVLAALAGLLALWLGLTAPTVSPVTPAGPPPALAVQAAAVVGTGQNVLGGLG